MIIFFKKKLLKARDREQGMERVNRNLMKISAQVHMLQSSDTTQLGYIALTKL